MMMNIKIYDVCKAFFCSVICTVLFLASFVNAWAAGCCFSLTDAQADKGRLFKVSLVCEGTEKIAAFVADIEYDSQALSYRSVSVNNKNAEYSINAVEEGKLRLAYLCEDGVDCADKEPLLDFTFKAEQAGGFEITAHIEQTIDADGTDVSINSEQLSAAVSIAGKGYITSNADENVSSGSDAEKQETSASADKAVTIDIKASDKRIIISVLALFLVFLCLAVVLIYRLGVMKRK